MSLTGELAFGGLLVRTPVNPMGDKNAHGRVRVNNGSWQVPTIAASLDPMHDMHRFQFSGDYGLVNLGTGWVALDEMNEI